MRVKEYPISQIVAPVIQGEGPEAGQQMGLVRFAGCDFDCSWCDTKYAVRPSYAGWTKIDMTAGEILARLEELKSPKRIFLTGGNPLLFVDGLLMEAFGNEGYSVSIETQGTRFSHMVLQAPALKWLVVSPKPPSSGMDKASLKYFDAVKGALGYRARIGLNSALKYVIFGQEDYEWVAEYDKRIGFEASVRRYLSVGATIDPLFRNDISVLRNSILDRTRWLMEHMMGDSRFTNFIVAPQLHTLVWGGVRTDV